MDEVFWSNVLKRWSDASENVIILKKELAKVQEERNLYRSLVNNLRRTDVRDLRQSTEHFREDRSVPDDEHIDSTVSDELQDAEVGLSKAKEEYRRLQQELSSSVEQIRALKLENERLLSEHQQQIAKLRDDLYQSRAIYKSRPNAHPPMRGAFEKTVYPDQIMSDVHEESTQSNVHPSTNIHSKPEFIIPLERQINGLKQSLEATELDKEHLRDELAMARDKLRKAEDNSKVLLASIVKLQNITRHSASGILHSISTNSLRSDSRRSSRKLSFGSASHSRHLDIGPDEHTKTSVDTAPHVDDKTIIGENASDLPCFLPPERERAIAKLPSVPAAAIDPSENVFDREFLKNALGDGMQSLIEYLPENRMDKTIISSYLCPTLNHHPWCPSNPGQHGFLFVGLGKEKESYKSPVIRNLFVGLPKGPTRGRTFRYLGRYKVARIKPLSVEEWHTLANDVRLMYAKVTKDKAQDVRSLENISLAYDKGDLLVPCVQLQYMGFDDFFYAALLSRRKTI